MNTIAVDRLVTALRRRGNDRLADTIEFEAWSFDEVAWPPTTHDYDQGWPVCGEFSD